MLVALLTGSMSRRAARSDDEDPLDGIHTPDRRYIVVRGRLWRATNPAIEERERDRLVHALMAARRAIARARRDGDPGAERRARGQVHRAKVALGERGPVWWSDGAPDENRRLAEHSSYAAWFSQLRRWRQAIEALLEQRKPGASICPSEIARAVSPRHWRSDLAGIGELARHLARHGALEITQRGHSCDPALHTRGPVRYRRPPRTSAAADFP